jgi:hypothetical protein
MFQLKISLGSENFKAGMVVLTYIFNTLETKAGGQLSSRPAWATKQDPVSTNQNKPSPKIKRLRQEALEPGLHSKKQSKNFSIIAQCTCIQI